ncbi:hypothetical protein [Dactylosporangium salmoneum]|uniref:Integral membrane protein n=1 Tax=Dactylosporangium salmoneum TaxID=53361 RepID=A0ABN3FUA3_9ACTN
MTTSASRPAALAATAGCLVMIAFQLSLAAGAPFGRAAWGGAHPGRLPADLRVSSAFAVVVWAVAALVLARRAGLTSVPPAGFARVATWVLGGLVLLGALPNFASPSGWERYLWGPFAVLLAILCFAAAANRR